MLHKHASDLDQCRVQIDVVGHDDGAHDSYGLFQLGWAAAGTVRQEHPLQQLPLVWLRQHILKQNKSKNTSHTKSNSAVIILNNSASVTHFYLITEAEGHDGDEEAKESFQFPEACWKI